MKMKIRYSLLYSLWIGVIIVLNACNPPPQPPPTPGSFKFQVKVMDIEGHEIQRARVELASDNNKVSVTKVTDSLGNAIIKIDESQAGEIGVLIVTADNYKPYFQYLDLEKNRLPAQVILESVTSDAQSQGVIGEGTEEIVATSQPTPTFTPTVTPTPTPTQTPTATPIVEARPARLGGDLPPTPTSTPTPTSIPPTDTPTPIPLEPPGAKAISGAIKVLAGPDVQNSALGTLLSQETGEIVGKTQNGEWLEIITPRSKQGWVASCQVELVNDNLDEVPVTWNRRVTPYDCSNDLPPAPVSSSSCLVIDIEQADVFKKPFDDVTLSWSNLPDGAGQLSLSVYWITDEGEQIYAVHPTLSDTVASSYFIGEWMFENTGATSGTLFTYEVEAQDAASKAICKTSGTLTP